MARTPIITRSLAVSRDLIYIVASFEDEEEAHLAPSRLYQYDSGTWRFTDYNNTIQALALYRATGAEKRALCVAGDEGDVVFPHDADRREKIIDPNTPLVAGKRLGRIMGLRQISSHLYAWGEGGQTYRRSDEGEWAVLDPRLLDEQGDPDLPNKMMMPDGQPIGTRLEMLEKYPEYYGEYTRRVLASDQNTIIYKLAGDTEQRMFASASKGRMFVWERSAFRAVPTSSTEALTDILLHGDQVLVCGRNGTFMSGDGHGAFRQVMPVADRPLFTTMASYNGLIYLASNSPQVLYASDLSSIWSVETNLDPDIHSVSRVWAVDGVLWVVGTTDIVRYDGTTWTRIGPPPNSDGRR